MRIALLIFSILMSLGLPTFAGSDLLCRQYYSSKINFFGIELKETGIVLSSNYIILSKRLAEENSQITLLKNQITNLESKVNTTIESISTERKTRPMLKFFDSSNPQNIKITELKRELDSAKQELKEKSATLIKLNKDHEATANTIKNAANEIPAINEKVAKTIWKQVNKGFKTPSIVTKSEYDKLIFDSYRNRFTQQYTFTVDLYGQSVKFKIAYTMGFRNSKSGDIEAYVFGYESSKLNKLQLFALSEAFKRNTILTDHRKILNGKVSIESKLKKLGFDLNDQKTKDLIAEMKRKSASDAKAAARAEELLDAANRRYQDGMSDSQNYLMYFYLYYMFHGNSTNTYLPPSHWVMYNLETSQKNQLAVGDALKTATEISNTIDTPITVDSFDSILNTRSSDIIGVKEAFGSETYKSTLIDSGIAEVLSISHEKVHEMDPTKSEDPAYTGATAVEEQVTGSNDHIHESPDTTYESPTYESPASDYSSPSGE